MIENAFPDFDPSKIGQTALYIFPLPPAIRVEAAFTPNGCVTVRQDGLDISMFCPSAVDHASRLCERMLSEPFPGITVGGEAIDGVTIKMDCLLTDDDINESWENWEELGSPSESAKLLILDFSVSCHGVDGLATTPGYRRTWMRRNENIFQPCARAIGLAPRWYTEGVASDQPSINWQMLGRCFADGYLGALISDNATSGESERTRYYVLKEENIEL